MSNTSGEKELKTEWPIEEGITLGTTKLRPKALLEPEENLTRVSERIGIY